MEGKESMRIISDEEARGVLTMPLAIEAIEAALVDYSSKRATVLPRAMIEGPNGLFRVMTASYPSKNVVGSKQGFRVSEQSGDKSAAYRSEIVTLYDFQSGELIAIVQSHSIDEFRTAAAAAIGAKHLSRKDSKTVALFGSGLHAGPQLLGLCAVRAIEKVRVYSPTRENREGFCKRMTGRLPTCEMIPVSSADEAVVGADIIIESTTSSTPVFDGSKVEEGTHITSIGGGFGGKRQIDDRTLERADLFVVGSKREVLNEGSPDVLSPIMKGLWKWDEIVEIGDIVAGRALGRSGDSQITLYKSLGMGLYDVALAQLVFEKLGSRVSD